MQTMLSLRSLPVLPQRYRFILDSLLDSSLPVGEYALANSAHTSLNAEIDEKVKVTLALDEFLGNKIGAVFTMSYMPKEGNALFREGVITAAQIVACWLCNSYEEADDKLIAFSATARDFVPVKENVFKRLFFRK